MHSALRVNHGAKKTRGHALFGREVSRSHNIRSDTAKGRLGNYSALSLYIHASERLHEVIGADHTDMILMWPCRDQGPPQGLHPQNGVIADDFD